MKIGYVPAVDSVVEFQQIIRMMKNADVEAQNTFINHNFNDFTTTLHDGDVIVLKSMAIFSSISELFTHMIALLKRDIAIESIEEPWFTVTQNQIELLQGISEMSRKLRSNRTQQGLNNARANGKVLGRPTGTAKLTGKIAEVERLHRYSKISIAKACATVGCNPRTYYRHAEKALA